MLMKKPKHRLFDYEPRFYNPEKDEVEKKKQRLRFSRPRRKSKSSLYLIALLLLIIYFIIKYGAI